MCAKSGQNLDSDEKRKIRDAARAAMKVFSIKPDLFLYQTSAGSEFFDEYLILNLKLTNAKFADSVLKTVDVKRKLGRTLYKLGNLYYEIFLGDLEDGEQVVQARNTAIEYLDDCICVYEKITENPNIKQNPEDLYKLGVATLQLSDLDFSENKEHLLKMSEFYAKTAISLDPKPKPKYFYLLSSVYQVSAFMTDADISQQSVLMELSLTTFETAMNLRDRIYDLSIYAGKLADCADVTLNPIEARELRGQAIQKFQDYFDKSGDSYALISINELMDDM